jgi:hypothetical protein
LVEAVKPDFLEDYVSPGSNIVEACDCGPYLFAILLVLPSALSPELGVLEEGGVWPGARRSA